MQPDPPPSTGTVYGRGGVDARGPKPGLMTRLHPLTIVAVTVGILGFLALGWVLIRAGSTEEQAVAATLTPPSSSAPPPATPAAKPATKLDVGDWYVSANGSYLTREGEYAAMAKDERSPFSVVRGLADESCFSFRTDDGRFLRHFDYRLRFDLDDESDLFQQDATFCPAEGGATGTIRLSSKNYPDHVIHRRDSELYIDENSGDSSFVKESSFTLQEPS
jgi:hypothetical protein